jgi:hypothetical protein
MFGTVISLITSILIAFFYTAQGLTFDLQGIRFVLTFSGSLFLFTAFIATSLGWSVLQRQEEESNPRVEELFLKDKRLRLILIVLFVFTLFSYIISFLSSESITWHTSIAIAIWIVLCGASFDLLCLYIRRLMKYSYQEFLLERVTDECLKSLRNGKNGEALEWLDAVVEVAVKAIKKSGVYLAGRALAQILTIIDGFVKNAGQNMLGDPFTSSDMPLLDKVQYLSAYVSKKLEWVYKNALRENQDPIAEDTINTFGKMSLYFVKWHPSLTHLPLVYIERCANQAIDINNEEVVTRACLTLSELAKNFIAIAKEKGESYRELIFLTLSHLEEILKNNFQRNKGIYPVLLMQPFAEIAQMIGSDGFKSFPDREAILAELKRILTEFNALDLVMAKAQAPYSPPNEGQITP